MRFPKDEALTEKLILHAIDSGVNYFDTAYIYGGSEAMLGRILHKHDKRREVNIATKLPPYLVKKHRDMDRIFNQQLERLQTDYIDYYLIHMITDLNVWKRLVDLGIQEWIAQKKAERKIRNIGFSYHGGKEEFVRICDAYTWEFCLIQYNYLDEDAQAGRSGLHHAAGKGIPVMIMEPLRGGSLVDALPRDAIRAFESAHVQRSPAEWALRWLWNQSEVTCVLSGMNGMDMLEENITVASDAGAGALDKRDLGVISQAKDALLAVGAVPCTGCGYCMPCPAGVDIPTCLSCLNDAALEDWMSGLKGYLMQTAMKSQPQIASRCNQCGRCEAKCPQRIEIRKELQRIRRMFEKFWFKPVVAVMRWFMRL
jgi:predicted aldo/keto reductase-like oxidoreductase